MPEKNQMKPSRKKEMVNKINEMVNKSKKNGQQNQYLKPSRKKEMVKNSVVMKRKENTFPKIEIPTNKNNFTEKKLKKLTRTVEQKRMNYRKGSTLEQISTQAKWIFAAFAIKRKGIKKTKKTTSIK